MKKFLENLLIIILVILLLFVIYSRYIKQEKIVDFFGYKFLLVLTGSMEPEIKSGSFIIIKSEQNYQIRRCHNL